MKLLVNQTSLPLLLSSRAINSPTSSSSHDDNRSTHHFRLHLTSFTSPSSSASPSQGAMVSATPAFLSPPVSSTLSPSLALTNLVIHHQLSYRNQLNSSGHESANRTAPQSEDEEQVWQQYMSNRALDMESIVVLVVVYTIMILIGAIGNGLVAFAVLHNPSMRTPRNLYITNLAFSDLLLCFFTIPFTLVDISSKFWPYGLALCKLVHALEATSIFVSTLSITAIAIDRYQLISRPTIAATSITWSHILSLIIIWLIGLLLALPLFLFSKLSPFYVGISEIDPIEFCIEMWPLKNGRLYYSIFSMMFQYILPFSLLFFLNTRLTRTLKTRNVKRTANIQRAEIKALSAKKTRTHTRLLKSIIYIFLISWFPLNIFNLVCDLFFFFSSDKSVRITFAVCHIIGVSSACSNPFLYGWFNETFQQEFKSIFQCLKRAVLSHMGVCMCHMGPGRAHPTTTCLLRTPNTSSFRVERRAQVRECTGATEVPTSTLETRDSPGLEDGDGDASDKQSSAFNVHHQHGNNLSLTRLPSSLSVSSSSSPSQINIELTPACIRTEADEENALEPRSMGKDARD